MLRLDPRTLFESRDLSHDLARKSVQGGMTTMGAQGLKFVLQVAGTAVLARLLTPADYGLVGMVTVVVNFAAMFKDAGLSMATVQKEEITHEQISTLFWINVLISASLGLCILAASPLVAWFYGKPELTPVTAALSLSFLLSGLTIQHQALQRRHMRFGTLAAIQIASQIVTLFVTIALTLLGWRYWALVGGTLANALAASVLTFTFCPWIPGRMRRGTGVREMLKFGAHVTGFDFVNYFARNADNILIGRFLGSGDLGLYSRAYQLFMLPITQIRGPLYQVAMPALSSLRNDASRYTFFYRRLLEVMAALTLPLSFYCAVEAEFLISLFLGSQWLSAVPIFRILTIAGLLQAIASTRGLVMVTCGLSSRYLRFGVANAIVCITSFGIGIPHGVEGVALSYTIANYVFLIPSLLYCFQDTPISVALFFNALWPPLTVSFAAGGGLIILRLLWDSESIIFHALCFGQFILVYLGLSLIFPTTRDTIRVVVSRLLSRAGYDPCKSVLKCGTAKA